MSTLDSAKHSIEVATLGIQDEFVREFGRKIVPPVPVEEIAECLRNYQVTLCDSQAEYGRDFLGAIDFEKKQVVVDESLDPTVNLRMLGRYLYTIGHELGHLELHMADFLIEERRRNRLGGPRPPIVCRTTSRKDAKEREAEIYSSYLLMPRTMVRDAWEAMTGSTRTYWATEEIGHLSRYRFWGRYPTVKFSKALSSVFQVSASAMQIRLIELGLIKIDVENLVSGLHRSWI